MAAAGRAGERGINTAIVAGACPLPAVLLRDRDCGKPSCLVGRYAEQSQDGLGKLICNLLVHSFWVIMTEPQQAD